MGHSELAQRIVETLRPADPGSWAKNFEWVEIVLKQAEGERTQSVPHAIEVSEHNNGNLIVRQGPEVFDLPRWVVDSVRSQVYRELVKELLEDLEGEALIPLRQWLIRAMKAV